MAVILGDLSGMLCQFKFGFTWRDLLLKKPFKRGRSWTLGSTDGRKAIWGGEEKSALD
jgi:hypothetical protein